MLERLQVRRPGIHRVELNGRVVGRHQAVDFVVDHNDQSIAFLDEAGTEVARYPEGSWHVVHHPGCGCSSCRPPGEVIRPASGEDPGALEGPAE